jgi:predicted HTH domain antitoxin
LQISKDRKKRVIDLYFNQHKTYAEIAQIEQISPRDISAIIKEEIARRQKYKDQELSAKAYKLFSEGKTTMEVVIALNLRVQEIINMYREYLFNISNSSTTSRSSTIMSLSILKRLALLECI